MNRAVTFALLLFVVALSPSVFAKGNFQAEGKIFAVASDGADVTFKFTGKIQLAYATAPRSIDTRSWKIMNFETRNLPVRIFNWTEPYKPSSPAKQSRTKDVHVKLLQLMNTGHVLVMSIDNPELLFSYDGDLSRINGTFVYAHDLEEVARSRDSAPAAR